MAGGWTKEDIDLDDPEGYHGGGIVTMELQLRERAKKAEEKRKKRIEEQRKKLAEAKRKRERMEETL